MKYAEVLGVVGYNGLELLNLFKSVRIETTGDMFEEYIIKDGESPESIADKLYDSEELYWVVLLVSKKYNRFNDFPVPETILRTKAKKEGWTDAYLRDMIISNNNKRIMKIVKSVQINRFMLELKNMLI
jgi:hypothetical protein